jgi:hypothetical protein
MGTLKFLRKIQQSDLEKTAHIKVSREVGRETELILKRFLAYHLGRPMKSLKFLEKMEKAGIV